MAVLEFFSFAKASSCLALSLCHLCHAAQAGASIVTSSSICRVAIHHNAVQVPPAGARFRPRRSLFIPRDTTARISPIMPPPQPNRCCVRCSKSTILASQYVHFKSLIFPELHTRLEISASSSERQSCWWWARLVLLLLLIHFGLYV